MSTTNFPRARVDMDMCQAAEILVSLRSASTNCLVPGVHGTAEPTGFVISHSKACDTLPPPHSAGWNMAPAVSAESNNPSPPDLDAAVLTGISSAVQIKPTPVGPASTQAPTPDSSAFGTRQEIQSPKHTASGILSATKNPARRKQQDFQLGKLDSQYTNKPSKAVRFCKSLGLHFHYISLETPEIKYQSLETFTAQLPIIQAQSLQQRPRTDEPSQMNTRVNALAAELGIHDLQRLQPIEKELCERFGIDLIKYRCIKARLMFGWACIIEQNLRGGSGRLRNCHPFLGGSTRFRCINLGSSQAQMMCRGFDANHASRVCTALQSWGWLATNDDFRLDGSVLSISPDVEERFPTAVRRQFVWEIYTRDTLACVPIENRMPILMQDLILPENGLKRKRAQCGCLGGSSHGPIKLFVLPQHTQSPHIQLTPAGDVPVSAGSSTASENSSQ